MLKEMLEYQKEEQSKVSLEKELSESKDRENASKIQLSLKKQHSDLIELEKSAEKIKGLYDSAIEKYNEYMKKVEALEKEIQNADPSKCDLYEKMYKDFVQVGTSLENGITNIYKKVQQINKDYEEIINKSKTDRKKFDEYRARFSKLKAEKEPKIKELEEKMSKIQKNINPKIFEIYNQKRDSHIFPVFVPLSDNKCGRCRMEVPASKLNKMKDNELGIIECESCGRYIYQSENSN